MAQAMKLEQASPSLVRLRLSYSLRTESPVRPQVRADIARGAKSVIVANNRCNNSNGSSV